MKGDRVRVVVDIGGGTTEFVVEAAKAGRKVEVVETRGGRMIEVRLLTRNDQPVLTDRFMASRVVALIEERVEVDEAEPDHAHVQMGLMTNAEAITFTGSELQDVRLVPVVIDGRESSDSGTDDDDEPSVPPELIAECAITWDEREL